MVQLFSLSKVVPLSKLSKMTDTRNHFNSPTRLSFLLKGVSKGEVLKEMLHTWHPIERKIGAIKENSHFIIDGSQELIHLRDFKIFLLNSDRTVIDRGTGR